jgi:REP-associated tyrosine transposase
MATSFRRKPNRLPMEVYHGPRVYSLTLACQHRRRWFLDARLVAECVEALRVAAQVHNARVYAYCFMPDHLHLLVHGGARTFLPDLMHDFKQVTGYAFGKATGRDLWQDGYYDHIVRSEEGVLRVARYIAANPVRAGLVADAAAYPYTGSLDWERASLVEA